MKKLLTLENTKKITSLLAIGFVLILYTIIKVPYFNQDFTGEHPMKYNAYVEPAIHMVENNSFTHYQKKYFANPNNNQLGQEDWLPQFPILEWELASTFKILQSFSIEQNTRLVMHMVGIWILIFSFLFIKEFTNKTIAFLFILLLATNPIFNLSTFVTVYDSVILIFLFASLYLLTLYLKQRKPIYLLTTAAIVAGLGIAAKLTLLLWIFPIVTIFFLFKSPNLYTKIFDLTVFTLFMGIPYIVTKYTIPTIGQNTLLNTLILFGSIFLVVFLTKYIEKQKQGIISYLELLHKNKSLIPLIILTFLPILLTSTYLFYDSGIAEEFITDSKLLLNLEMYIFMGKQFVRHLGIPLAVLGITGLICLKFIRERDIKILSFAFLTSGFFFLLTSAKSIFFHDYYTVFLMVVALLFSSIAIYFIMQKTKHIGINALLLTLIFFFILIPRISSSQERFETQQEDFDKALEYFIENTENEDFYIDEVQATYFSLYSKRPRVGDLTMLESENFKKDVLEIGFKNTMDKYNIKYLITFNDEPEYERYVNIFSQEKLKKPSYRRTDLILSIVNPEKYQYFEDTEEREKIIEEFRIKEKFVLEKEIGDFKFFTFVD